jgi:hypothetical protein
MFFSYIPHVSRQLAAKACLISLTILIPAFPLCAQNTIGHVVDIDEHGNWYLYPEGANSNRQQKVMRWQDVPAGCVIRIRSPQTGDYVTIVDSKNRILVTKKCGSPNDCYQPIFLPRDLKDVTPADEEHSRNLFKRLRAEPYLQSMFRMRGGSLQLEGVGLLANGYADLRDVMLHAPQGKYSLQPYAKLGAMSNGRENETVGAVTLNWDPHHTALVSTGSLKPGLYEISLEEAADEDSPIVSVSVRVLLCSEQEYHDVFALYQNFRASTQQWGDTVKPEIVHAFLRAYLTDVANTLNRDRK